MDGGDSYRPYQGGRGRGRGGYGPEDFTPRKRNEGQRPVDFFTPAIHHVKTRMYRRNSPFSYHVPPHPYYCNALLPARVTADNPATAICTQWVNSSHLQAGGHGPREQFCAIEWAPDGRRLLCSTTRGAFYLFNGHSFATETRTTAHEGERAVRALAWGKTTDLIVSADEAGVVKLWQKSLVMLAQFNSNSSQQQSVAGANSGGAPAADEDQTRNAVRDVAFAPGEAKFVTCGKDGFARVWDTNTVGTNGGGSGAVQEEVRLEGHGNDVQSVDWHPTKSLILSGSSDNAAKLWDPRAGRTAACLATLDSHAQVVLCARWCPSGGNEFLTSHKNGTIALWDLRRLKEVATFMGNHSSREVPRVAWHPTHSRLFTSAGADGSLVTWVIDPAGTTAQRRSDGVAEVITPAAHIPFAHDRNGIEARPINAIAWSPLGHLLASAASEVKYWHRNKPGAEEETVRSGEADPLGAIA